MKNEFQRHKKSDGIKWVATFLAVVLLAVAVTAAITKGFKDWNPYGWFDKKDPAPPVTGSVTDGDGNNIPTDGTVHQMPSRMIFRAAAAGEVLFPAITLQATVRPDNATNKTVDWSVAFVNPQSEWATGKTVTDYIAVTPTADGSTTAQINCADPFGEQVKITVTSRDNNEAKAECIVDFAKRISDLTVRLHDWGADSPVVSTASGDQALSMSFTSDSSYHMTVEPTYGVGTLTDTFTYNVTFTLGGTSILLFSTAEIAPFGEPTETFTLDVTDRNSEFSSGYDIYQMFMPSAFIEDYEQRRQMTTFMKKFANRVIDTYEDPLGTFAITATGAHSSFEKNVNLNFTAGTLHFSVESLSFDDSTLVF